MFLLIRSPSRRRRARPRPALDAGGGRRVRLAYVAAAKFRRRVEGGAQWGLTLPDRFAIARRLASIVRIRVGTMLSADDGRGTTTTCCCAGPADGRLAHGRRAAAPLLHRRRRRRGAVCVAAALAASAGARRRCSLALTGAASELAARPSLRRLRVRGRQVRRRDRRRRVPRRRRRGATSRSRRSRRSRGTARTRRGADGELGQERNVDVLWLLTLSADEAAWSPGSEELEGVAGSFVVT